MYYKAQNYLGSLNNDLQTYLDYYSFDYPMIYSTDDYGYSKLYKSEKQVYNTGYFSINPLDAIWEVKRMDDGSFKRYATILIEGEESIKSVTINGDWKILDDNYKPSEDLFDE